ncbi:MAG: flagellar protein export ATPase FliI [SAR86 cluster bacterium]|uniref:Flagellum-specific ATP synthase n=1 Tax=SAR86 cluster bacterium TaxID=2030880 RepID=A0A2A5CBG4_9GAMM|nr:flagellar protein export ATPase FliI [Gammaproteobacteria bacterium AH-315-E17]PCJ40851.1 MAG: flagellar protein export ATPase FliI [SAR86 cluster bacterium]
MISENQQSVSEQRNSFLLDKLQRYTHLVNSPELPVEGRLIQMTGLTLVASGCRASIGNRCKIVTSNNNEIEAEVVGFSDGNLYLMPIGRIQGLNPGARVIPIQHYPEVGVGNELLGRVIDASGDPIDKKGELSCKKHVHLLGPPINPFARMPIDQPLDVGIRVINSMLTLGRGQRMGLFAGSGVGKSVLLGQMTKFTEADVVVVGLIGERGREVREFVENILGPEDLEKAVVVATPADDPPLMRLHGAWRATAIAEHFRDQGLHVLLLMDSLTRFAQAQRELALAIGEPPVTKGYPPSVFAQIPQLVERAGNGFTGTGGSITAIYTVLVEGDDQNEPIADATRAILDGHIVLSRSLAEAGIYPAINIEASISRVMNNISEPTHTAAAIYFKQLYSLYEQNRDLINVGAYQTGTDPEIDKAITYFPLLQQFIKQGISENSSYYDSLEQLYNIFTTEVS